MNTLCVFLGLAISHVWSIYRCFYNLIFVSIAEPSPLSTSCPGELFCLRKVEGPIQPSFRDEFVSPSGSAWDSLETCVGFYPSSCIYCVFQSVPYLNRFNVVGTAS